MSTRVSPSLLLVSAIVSSSGLVGLGHCCDGRETPNKPEFYSAFRAARLSKHDGGFSPTHEKVAHSSENLFGKPTIETPTLGRALSTDTSVSSIDASWWIDRQKFDEASFPGLLEAVGRFYDTFNRSLLLETEASIDQLHSSYKDTAKPRAALLILSQMLHCGPSCESPNARNHNIKDCTQRTSIANLLKAISRNFYARVRDTNYPTVIFHEDFDDDDRAFMEAASSAPIFFQRIVIAEETLPSYMHNRDSILSGLRALHPQNNVSLPPGFHGFGYRQMCRFYAGLVFYAPVLRKFDWYMRLDGGDSRLGPTLIDPFRELKTNGQDYGFLQYANYPSPQLEPGLKRFNETFTSVHWDKDLLEKWRLGQAVYNNFEVVHMSPFRNSKVWSFFQQFDQEAFFLSQTGAPRDNSPWVFKDAHKNALGDAEFRSLTLAMLTTSKGVRRFEKGSEIAYTHPVPNWCQEAPKSRSKLQNPEMSKKKLRKAGKRGS